MLDRIERINAIKAKGFSLLPEREHLASPFTESLNGPIEYNDIKIGTKKLTDATFSLGDLKKANPDLANKETVLRAINDYDLKKMREISDFFYKTSGIYSRILRYMAFMYRYDWFITPYDGGKAYMIDNTNGKKDKLIEGFNNSLSILDNFNVKKNLGEIALKILRHGCYYGYKIPQGDSYTLQELSPNYCRSRFNYKNKPAVEFNMKFFDDYFRDTEQRNKMLNLFPKEFAVGYRKYKKNQLPPQFAGDTAGWYLLDPTMTVRFTANGEEYPAFISVIPLILDLDEAQALEKKKALQQLLKIVIQKMPLDKNGDLLFDIDEMRQLHNNAVQMLGRAIGIDVLTTFAEVTVEDMTETAASAQADNLEKVERQLYNEAGVSQMQFNTDGNIALEKSILNDESTMYNMLLQFQDFLNELIEKSNKNPKKMKYSVQLLTTTIYNYQTLAKLYKEQMQIGYSKMLSQIALGQSQSSILASAHFENDILSLVDVFIPPMSSNTMNAQALERISKKGGSTGVNSSDGQTGRPTKESQGETVTEKTIQNKESQS